MQSKLLVTLWRGTTDGETLYRRLLAGVGYLAPVLFSKWVSNPFKNRRGTSLWLTLPDSCYITQK